MYNDNHMCMYSFSNNSVIPREKDYENLFCNESHSGFREIWETPISPMFSSDKKEFFNKIVIESDIMPYANCLVSLADPLKTNLWHTNKEINNSNIYMRSLETSTSSIQTMPINYNESMQLYSQRPSRHNENLDNVLINHDHTESQLSSTICNQSAASCDEQCVPVRNVLFCPTELTHNSTEQSSFSLNSGSNFSYGINHHTTMCNLGNVVPDFQIEE